MKEQIVLRPDVRETVLEFKGKKYRLKKDIVRKGHAVKVIYEEFNEKEYDKRIQKIAKKLVKSTNLKAVDVIENILKSTDMNSIKKLEKQLTIHKPKLEKGCLGIRIGKGYITIIE